jgi:oxygen-independent coproporphyrinogen III oxidase
LTKSGYLHYEISNYCKEGFYSKHNTNYWKGSKYLGLGPSAHSFNGNSRQWNVSNIKQYIDKITSGEIPAQNEILTDTQKYNEYILVTLRTMWGCNSNYVLQTFGKDIYENLLNGVKRFKEQGMLEIAGNTIILTNKGKLFADLITSELFVTE